MTNAQLWMMIAGFFGANTLLILYMKAEMRRLEGKIDALREVMLNNFAAIEKRFEAIDKRFEAINQRFDDMRDLWRAELHRVEGVLDARLKSLEDRS